LKELKKGNNMVKYEKARLEEDNSQDIYYILDKMNKFDQSLKEHLELTVARTHDLLHSRRVHRSLHHRWGLFLKVIIKHLCV
jgi:hypothetical protein